MSKEVKAEYIIHHTKSGKEIEAIYLNGKLWRHLSGYPKARRACASHIMELKEYYGFYTWLIQIAPDSGDKEGVIDIPLKALEQLLPWQRKWIDRALRRLHNHHKSYVLFYPAGNQFTSTARIIIPKYSDRTWGKYKSLVLSKKMISTKCPNQNQGVIWTKRRSGFDNKSKSPQVISTISRNDLDNKSKSPPETPRHATNCGPSKAFFKPYINTKPYLSYIYNRNRTLLFSEAMVSVSDSMREVLEYFFSETGKESIELVDLDFIHLLEQKHTPEVIQKQITAVIESFKENGQDPKDITLWCIWVSLRDQNNSRKGSELISSNSIENPADIDEPVRFKSHPTVAVDKNDHKESPSADAPKTNHKSLPAADDLKTKESKTGKKKDCDQAAINEIFDYWNSKEIIKHREIERFKAPIKARLQKYTPKEIIQAINNYNQILKSPEYYWSHKYDLDKFLKPRNIDRFLNENNPFENYRNKPFNQASQVKLPPSDRNKTDQDYLEGTEYDPKNWEGEKDEK
ncbi:MAG: hypothetical protein JXA79_07540 [Deltaproteobacteria bacterium]|nr:hypothetical protein [Deltaproteobacteria bacterium]